MSHTDEGTDGTLRHPSVTQLKGADETAEEGGGRDEKGVDPLCLPLEAPSFFTEAQEGGLHTLSLGSVN